MNSQEINNNVLGAVQILIDKSMTNLMGGETVICTIVDDTERQLGKYRVSPNEVVIYDAYSENTEYLEGEQVLVLIPDKSSDKRTIIRKYISKNTLEPLHYVSPAKQFVKGYSLWQDVKLELIEGSIEKSITATLEKQDIDTSKFNTVYLTAKFSCNNDAIISGNYGLKLTIEEASPADVSKPLGATLILDSSEMMGNPYRFIVPFAQEKIGYWKDLPAGQYNITLTLYHKNNFKNGEGVTVTAPVIIASDIIVQFGYDIVSIPNKTVKLFYSGDNIYTKAETRDISLVWYNKTEDNEYLGFDKQAKWASTLDEAKQCGVIVEQIAINEEHKINLTLETNQRVILKAKNEDEFKDWLNTYVVGALITYTVITDDNVTTYTANRVDADYLYFIDWQQDNNRGNLVSMSGEVDDPTKYKCTCQTTLDITRVTATVWENGFAYPADKILEFKNQGDKTINLNLNGITMKIEHGDHSKDGYNFYEGSSNHLIDNTNAYLDRTLRFNWDADIPTNAIQPEFWNGATITWYVPTQGSMIVPAPSHGELTSSNGYYEITKTIEYNTETKSLDNSTIELKYRVKDYYSPLLTNNTIKCAVKLEETSDDGTTKTQYLNGEITLGFGLFGTSGTDYTIVVTSSKIVENDKEYTLRFQVIDVEGNASELKRPPQVRLNAGAKWEKCEVSGTEYSHNFKLQIGSYNSIEISALVDFKGKEVNIVSHFPIIVYDNKDKTDIDFLALQLIFPTTIFYDYNGQNPEYLTDAWKIVDENGDNSWIFMLEYYDYVNSSFIVPDDEEYAKTAIGLPKYIDNKFLVPPIYVNQTSYGVAIRAVKKVGEDEEAPYLRTPLLITQNKYFSTLLNEWNGALAVDDDNNYILSAMTGAGEKNSDNTFSGIIMGKKAILDPEFNNFEDYEIGLFGFHNGVQSYEFNIDGTAFIGTAGLGQIKFDGNRGYIASPNVTIDSDGNIQMPLTGGSIFDLSQGNLWLQQSDNDYFKFVGDEFEIKMGVTATSPTVKPEATSIITPTDYSSLVYINKREFYIGTKDAYLSFLQTPASPTPSFSLKAENFAIGEDENSNVLLQINQSSGFQIKTAGKLNFSVADSQVELQSSNAIYTIKTEESTQTLYYKVYTPIYKNAGRTGVWIYSQPIVKSEYAILKPNNEKVFVDVNNTSKVGDTWLCVPCTSEGKIIGYDDLYDINPENSKLTPKACPLYYIPPQTSADKATILFAKLPDTTSMNDSNSSLITADGLDITKIKIGYINYSTDITPWLTQKVADIPTDKQEVTFTIPSSTTNIQGSKITLSDKGGYTYYANSQKPGSIIIGNDPNDASNIYALQIGTFKVQWDGTVEGIQKNGE